MSDFGKLAIGVRIGSMVDPSFFFCWTMLLRSKVMRDGDGILNPAVGLPHGPACNIILGWFLRSGCDSLMLLDDDMEFTPDAIETLRSDDHGFDVLSSMYVTRKARHVPLVITGRNAETSQPVLADFDKIKGVMPVDYVGFGGVIIKRWVLEAAMKLYGDDPVFAFDPKFGEDGRFCNDVRRVGGTIGVNTNARMGHRTQVALYWNKEAKAIDFSENDYGLGLVRQQEERQKQENEQWSHQ